MAVPLTATDLAHSSDINLISVSLPPFWHHDPQIWFTQVHAQFAIRNITHEQTMFYHVLAVLPPEIVADLRDILSSPDKAKPYSQLRDAIIQRTAISEHKRLERLISGEALDGRTPSQFLRHLYSVLGDRKLDDSLFKQLFLKRLPTQVQAILASSADNVPLTQLASIADNILEIQPGTTDIHAVETNCVSKSINDRLDDLAKQLAELRLNRPTRRRSSRTRSSTRIRSPSSSRTPTVCWYHSRFGHQARKCTQPCFFRQTQPSDFPLPGNEQARR